MRIFAFVIDMYSREPIPGVSAVVYNGNQKTNTGTVADEDGVFDLSSPLLDAPGAKLALSHVNYETSFFTPNPENIEFALVPKESYMDEVIVTAKRNTPASYKNDSVPVLIATASITSFALAFFKTWPKL